jgi:hypothetical protein
MDGTCGTHGSDEKGIKFLVGKLHHSEYLGVDGKIILEWILVKEGWT